MARPAKWCSCRSFQNSRESFDCQIPIVGDFDSIGALSSVEQLAWYVQPDGGTDQTEAKYQIVFWGEPFIGFENRQCFGSIAGMYEVRGLIGYWMMLHDCQPTAQVPGRKLSTHCHADTSHDANATQRFLRCAWHQEIIYLLEIQRHSLLTPKPQYWDTVRRRQSDGEMDDQGIRVDVVMPELDPVSRRRRMPYHVIAERPLHTMISGLSERSSTSSSFSSSSYPSLFSSLVGFEFEFVICRLSLMSSSSPDQRTLSQSVPFNLSKPRFSKALQPAWNSASLMEGNVSRNAI